MENATLETKEFRPALKFEFGKYTEVTDLALNLNPEYSQSGYIRIFLCPDVYDVWICRILKGYDEDYVVCPESYILERNQIPHNRKGQNLGINRAMKILTEDDFENWDIKQSFSINELLEMVDGGFGILNLREDFETE